MPFELPDNLHPDCGPVAWLLGTWRGNGHGDYPTIEPFQFGQELIFPQDGRPFFHYMSRAWIVDERARRSATPRRRPASCAAEPEGTVELLLAHNTGFVEIWYGDRRGRQARDAPPTPWPAPRPPRSTSAGKRLYGYVKGDLLYAYDMAADGPGAPAAHLGPAASGSEHGGRRRLARAAARAAATGSPPSAS